VRLKSSFELSGQAHNPGNPGDIPTLLENGNGRFFIHGDGMAAADEERIFFYASIV